MIVLNGKKFAETEQEFNDSLFDRGGTCVGYARRLKRKIKLMNHNKELVGVVNGYGCLLCATKRDEGYWYSFATINLIGEYDSYRQSVEEPESYAVKSEYRSGEKHLYFK